MQSTKSSLPTLPFMSVRPLQPGVSANVPVESNKVMRRRVVSSRASKRHRVSRKCKNIKNMYNHTLAYHTFAKYLACPTHRHTN